MKRSEMFDKFYWYFINEQIESEKLTQELAEDILRIIESAGLMNELNEWEPEDEAQ